MMLFNQLAQEKTQRWRCSGNFIRKRLIDGAVQAVFFKEKSLRWLCLASFFEKSFIDGAVQSTFLGTVS